MANSVQSTGERVRFWFTGRRQQPIRNQDRRRRRLQLEVLEDRTLPAAIGDVFVINMENHNLTQPSSFTFVQQLQGNSAAPYLNSLMTPGNPNAAQASYASNYTNVPGIHPSEPNYVWRENGGVTASPLNDNDPFPDNIVNGPNLSAVLQSEGIPWKSYQEDIDLTPTSGSVNQPGSSSLTSTVAPQSQWTVPLVSFSGTSAAYVNPYNNSNQYGFTASHDGQLFFLATNGGNNFLPSNPETPFYAPLQQLQTDLTNNTVARYNYITPDEYNDMHSPLSTNFVYRGVTYTGNTDQEAVAQGDNFLSLIVPKIMASPAYQNNGAIFISFDETEGGDTSQFTLPAIVISPLAKGNAYDSTLPYTHSSYVRLMQEVFGVAPGGTDMADLFVSSTYGSTVTVSTTADTGVGSLRQAIMSVDATDFGSSFIGFYIGAGVQVIAPASPLPAFTRPVYFDAAPTFPTQAIELNGMSAGAGANGLTLSGGSSVINGASSLDIVHFGGSGIVLQTNGGDRVYKTILGVDFGDNIAGNGTGISITSSGNHIGDFGGDYISGNGGGILISGSAASGNIIAGNVIGADFSGTSVRGNGASDGVLIQRGASGNMIGGFGTNIIDGNFPGGVRISGSGTTGNIVANNVIGLDVTGTKANGNEGFGVEIDSGASGNLIGAVGGSGVNLISANGMSGVIIGTAADTVATTQNIVTGNVIGADVTGKVALGNMGDGVLIQGALTSANTIGNPVGSTINLISGNTGFGVDINGLAGTAGGAPFNLVEGNAIGTDVSGTKALGNQRGGIEIQNNADFETIGSVGAPAINLISGNGGDGILLNSGFNTVSGNVIGADVSGAAKLGNGGAGVEIPSSNNVIGIASGGGMTTGQENIIAFNGAAGIVVDTGVSNSFLGDSIFSNTDLGIVLNQSGNANNNQPAPVISSVMTSGGTTTISGTVTAAANTTYIIEFFSSPTSTAGQGKTGVGFASITTNGSGMGTFNFQAAALPSGQFITALATDPLLDTSMFSNAGST